MPTVTAARLYSDRLIRLKASLRREEGALRGARARVNDAIALIAQIEKAIEEEKRFLETAGLPAGKAA